MSLLPVTDFRPWPVRGLNALLPRVWASGLLHDADLNVATLTAQARRQTGLSDFGDDGFARAQLGVLLPALRTEAALHPAGRLIAHGSLLKVLKERLWAQALFAAHPEILARPLGPPVVIVGHMRSGTTRIHRLLACDDRFAALRLFEAICPVPWPSSFARRTDPRIAYTARGLRLLHWLNPAIAAIHPTAATAVDEELGLLEHSFSGAQIEAQRRVPSFARHSETHDQTPAYLDMRRLLQLAGWFRGQDPALPWLLKTPQHMQDLPALLRVFPGAKLIFTHRDLATVVASSASLAWHQMVVQSDHVDPHWVGGEWLHKTVHRARVAASVRPALPRAQAIDVEYDAVDADWHGEIGRIYGWLGLEPSATTLTRMAAVAASPGPGGHRYRLGDFGLNAALVASQAAATTAFADAGDVRGGIRQS